jgi:anti-anti-sigma factor
MSYRAGGTAAAPSGPDWPRCPGAGRPAAQLTMSCASNWPGPTTVTLAGELDVTTADQAYGYVREVIDVHRGAVMLDVAGLSFCDARGLAALARMSRHARQSGCSLHLVAPRPQLVKIIRITGLDHHLPVHSGDQPGAARRLPLARPA